LPTAFAPDAPFVFRFFIRFSKLVPDVYCFRPEERP
jgi:hypothetical protein